VIQICLGTAIRLTTIVKFN